MRRRRRGSRSGAVLLAAALFGAAISPAAAEDARPEGPPGQEGTGAATRVSLTIWNDSTTGSVNGIGMLWGARNLDGNDLGFTHGMTLAVEFADAGGMTRTATVSSKLYTRRIGDPSLLGEDEPIPIWCTEEDIVSLALDNRRRGRPFYYRLGGGFLSNNKGANPLGSLRQQLEFHALVHTSDLAHYDYFHDGRNAFGLFAHTAAGIQGARGIGRALRLSGFAELAVEPNTVYAASQLTQRLEGAVAAPVGRARLEARLGADTALHPGGVEFLPRVSLSLTLGRWTLTSAVTYPQGELRNHARYNDDKDAIATATLSLTL